MSQALDFVGGVHPRFDRAKAEAFLAKTDIPRDSRVHKLSKGMITLGALSLTAGVVVPALIYTVNPGERAIIFNRFKCGISQEVRGEGYHLYLPFLQEVIKYDVKIQPFDFFSFTGSKDMQKVEIKIKIFYKCAH